MLLYHLIYQLKLLENGFPVNKKFQYILSRIYKTVHILACIQLKALFTKNKRKITKSRTLKLLDSGYSALMLENPAKKVKLKNT